MLETLQNPCENIGLWSYSAKLTAPDQNNWSRGERVECECYEVSTWRKITIRLHDRLAMLMCWASVALRNAVRSVLLTQRLFSAVPNAGCDSLASVQGYSWEKTLFLRRTWRIHKTLIVRCLRQLVFQNWTTNVLNVLNVLKSCKKSCKLLWRKSV